MKIAELTTPHHMRLTPNQESDIIAEMIENAFRHSDKGKSTYTFLISGEYSVEACNIIQNCYKNVGWSTVICAKSTDVSRYARTRLVFTV